jgi:hypothetical protein
VRQSALKVFFLSHGYLRGFKVGRNEIAHFAVNNQLPASVNNRQAAMKLYKPMDVTAKT